MKPLVQSETRLVPHVISTCEVLARVAGPHPGHQVIADCPAACVQELRQGPQERQQAGRAATAGVQKGANLPPAVLPTRPPCPTPGHRPLGPVQLVVIRCLQVSAALCVRTVCPAVPTACPCPRCWVLDDVKRSPAHARNTASGTLMPFFVCQLRPHTASAEVAAYASLDTC